jgi:hypothetical protein
MTPKRIALIYTGAAFLDEGRVVHRWNQSDLAEGPARFEASVMRALGELTG